MFIVHEFYWFAQGCLVTIVLRSLVISDCCITEMHLLPYNHRLTLLFAQQQKATELTA